MKNFFDNLYASPWGRLARRFVVVGGSAVFSYFVSAGKLVLSPEGLVDSVLQLSSGDLVFAVKMFIGAGLLGGLDKMRREGSWQWLAAKVDKPVGEQ